jgi:signal peptidase I
VPQNPPTARSGAAPKHNSALEYAVIAVAAIVIAFTLQAFVVKPYRIPSESMVPTLLIRDRVLANRFIYHLREPQRGDIVVFRYPVDERLTFIKRLIGLPGDVISLDEGKVVVNGKPLDEPYLAQEGGRPVPTNPDGPPPGSTMAAPWSLTQPYTVGKDEYFVMGDNRLNSDDSRVWGPVPKDNLIGLAFLVYWPPGRIKTL